MIAQALTTAVPLQVRERVETAIDLLGRFPMAVIQLAARFAIADVFWRSAQSKIASWQSTVQLFRDEYQVPLLPPAAAATIATTFELACPVLLALGLATRLGTGMTMVIQLSSTPKAGPSTSPGRPSCCSS
jgi:putative oxidoreductase